MELIILFDIWASNLIYISLMNKIVVFHLVVSNFYFACIFSCRIIETFISLDHHKHLDFNFPKF